MRITISNTARNHGGQETQAALLAERLGERGHEVMFLCRPVSPLLPRLRERVRCEPVLSGFDGDPIALWRARRALQRHRSEVLLATTNKDMRSAAVAARSLGVPVVIRRGMGRSLRPMPHYRFLYGSLPAQMVVNSEDTRRVQLESAPWLDPNRVSVIYNGIEVERFAAASPAELGLPQPSIRIGYVGQFVPRKGLDTLSEAWPRIAASVGDAYLLLAGRGTLEGATRERLTAAPRVRFLGFRQDVPALMAALDLLVHPAREEGIPNVIMEAMAAGKPVVSTAVGGIAELVREGVDGRLVSPDDPAALAQVVVELIQDPERSRRMGEQGREQVLRTCSLERMIDQYEELLREVVSASPKRARDR